MVAVARWLIQAKKELLFLTNKGKNPNVKFYNENKNENIYFLFLFKLITKPAFLQGIRTELKN